MDNIETLRDHFQGGAEGGWSVNSWDIANNLSDALKSILYNHISLTSRQPFMPDQLYSDNKSFWQDAIASRHFPGTKIVLARFHLTEWMPFSPGLYFTHKAAKERRYASYSFSHERKEYTPQGKDLMIRGGIGTVRLAEKVIRGHTVFFLGASSTGIAHQGIPIAIPMEEYRKVISPIRDQGGCLATITGTLHTLTEEMPSLRYERDIPRYCFFAEEINLHKETERHELLTTVAIMFTAGNIKDFEQNDNQDENILNKSWAFCSFHPCAAQQDVQHAAKWLKDYAIRYSSTEPRILTDFDEQYRLFPSVEFPLSEIMRCDVDLDRLRVYRDRLMWHGDTYINNYINIKEKIMGDKIEVSGSGHTIVNHSSIQNAFNKVKSQYDDATAQTLKRIEAEINNSGNTEAAENFDSFNDELQKPEPRKSILKSLWQRTTASLPILLKLPGVMEDIKKLLGP